MIYTRRTNCDSLQVFQSIISIFEIYNHGLERKQIIFFFFQIAEIKTKPIFWKYSFFFAGNLKSTVFIANQSREITEICSLQIELLQFFWSKENSISLNSFSRTKLVHLKCIDRWLWCSVTIGHQFHCQESNSNYA